MSGMFVSNELIDIPIKYVVTDGLKPPIIITSEEDEKKHGDKVKTMKTKWSRQNWKLSTELTRGSMTFNMATGQPMIDFMALRDSKLKKFLKEWDLKDNNGQNIPCNDEMKDQMHPSMATYLVDQYNEITLPSEEDEKK